MVSRCIHVIGIGAGDPDYMTVQAIEALNDTQVFFVTDKGEAKSDLVALRQEICSRFIREPGVSIRRVARPRAVGTVAGQAGYREAVSDWHAARAQGLGGGHRRRIGSRRRGRLPGLG